MAISTAVPTSAVARVIGIKTKFIDTNVGGTTILPQHVAIFGQGATGSVYSTDKATLTSASAVGAAYGYGSPLHLAALQLKPSNGDGIGAVPLTVFPLEDDVSGVAAEGDITLTGTATSSGALRAVVSGIQSSEFTAITGEAPTAVAVKLAAAINGVLSMPVIAVAVAGVVTLTAKWAGISSNGISVVMSGDMGTGVTFTVTQPTGGLVNPSLDDALAQMGNVWYTMSLNCLNVEDSTALDALQVKGEGRWGALVRKPFVAFTGHAFTDYADIVAITDNRKDDRVNTFPPNPGSANLPFVSAAGQIARIVVVANDNPARDYGRQEASYIEPGADGDQWEYDERNAAVSAGASTVEVVDGVVQVSDTVTAYHPTGEDNPGYRWVKDIIKLQNIIFNVDLIFNTKEWDGAPMIPDDQPTTNASAKKPKNARSALNALTSSLGLAAIISDTDYTKENTQAEIDSSNQDRMNVVYPVKVSGNVNINSIDLNFGFYFGSSTTVS